jgi:hypothetical protein
VPLSPLFPHPCPSPSTLPPLHSSMMPTTPSGTGAALPAVDSRQSATVRPFLVSAPFQPLPSSIEAALTSPFPPCSFGTSPAPRPTPSLARTPPRAAAPSRHTTSPSPRRTGGFHPFLTCLVGPLWAHGTRPRVLVDPREPGRRR